MGLILQSRQGRKVSIKRTGGAKKRRKPSKVLKEYALTVAKNGAVSLSARAAKPAKKAAKKAAKKRAKKSAAPRRRKLRAHKPAKPAKRRRIKSRRPQQLSLF